MGFVVEAFEFGVVGLLAFGKGGLRVEVDAGDDHLAGRVFGEVADGAVGVALDGDFAHGADGEEGEHVAAGEGGDESLLGVDFVGVAEVVGSGGGVYDDGVPEVPCVVAGVGSVGEGGIAAFPSEGGYVF